MKELNCPSHESPYEVEIWKDFLLRSPQLFQPKNVVQAAAQNNPATMYKFEFENMAVFAFQTKQDVTVNLDIGYLDHYDKALFDNNCRLSSTSQQEHSQHARQGGKRLHVSHRHQISLDSSVWSEDQHGVCLGSDDEHIRQLAEHLRRRVPGRARHGRPGESGVPEDWQKHREGDRQRRWHSFQLHLHRLRHRRCRQPHPEPDVVRQRVARPKAQ